MGEAVEAFDAQLQRLLRGEKDTCVSTSLSSLDWVLGGGLRPGQLWVLAARPGVGKTVFALRLAAHASQLGHRVAFFSMEMSQAEITQRLCCDLASVDWQRFKLGSHTQDDLVALVEA
jgi:replicative DNA helicase